MSAAFNPAAVPIPCVLDHQQVNLILEALGKLPYERVEPLYTGLRAHALQVLQDAERLHNDTTAAGAQEPHQAAPVEEHGA